MADEKAGSAWYELDARSEPLREALRKAEADIKRAGDAGERMFATPMERATGRVTKSVDELGRELNSLSGKTPAQVADALDRAEREADQALAAIRQLAREDLPPQEAQRYADALNEIQVEADQTVADLRELQRADPRFDTAELNRAAGLIDKVGDEATETSTQLSRMAKGDTHLEGVARQAKHAARELETAQSRAQRFRSSLASLKGVIAGLGIAFGLQQAIGLLKDAVTAATGLEEAGSKVDQVFADLGPEVHRWAEGSAEGFLMSKRAALEAAGTYGNLLQAFGVARPAAVEMSKTLVELAADLASFNNTSVEEAITALRSGLSGETEPLKRYGVALNDVRLKQEAMRLGLIETTSGTLPVAIKAQAAYALILKDTALAQGDVERTSGGLANQQRQLEAELENVNAEVGERMIPLMLQLVHFIRDQGIPAITAMLGAAEDLGEGFAEVFGDRAGGPAEWRQRLLDTMFATKDDVLRIQEELGIGYLEAHALMQQADDAWAGGHEEAVARVLAQQKVLEGAQAWERYQAQIRGGADGIADAAGAAAAGIPEAFGAAADEAVEEIDSMYSRMAAAIKAREDELRQAGGDAVTAWLDPQVWTNQATIIEAEIVEANEALLEAQRNGTKAEVAEAQNRVLQLTAEAYELKTNLATVGTDMEQLAALQSLRTSQFMLDGLSSEDEEIQRTFQAWAGELDEQIAHMQREVEGQGPQIPALLESGIEGGTGGVHGAIDGLTSHRPDTSWAYGVGAAIPSLIELGISENQWKAQSAAAGLAQVLREPMPGSEPKDRSSALYGITDAWGLVDTVAGGIYRHLPAAHRVSRALAEALAPDLERQARLAPFGISPAAFTEAPMPSAPTARRGDGGGDGGADGGRHVHIHAIQGFDVLRNVDDVQRAAQRALWLEEGGWRG